MIEDENQPFSVMFVIPLVLCMLFPQTTTGYQAERSADSSLKMRRVSKVEFCAKRLYNVRHSHSERKLYILSECA